MAATVATNAVRFQLGLRVGDLDRSVAFYRALLGLEPAKRLDTHARFEVDEPPLEVALHLNSQAPGGALNHVGLRFPSSEGLVDVQRRLEEAGFATQRQEGVECCYSRQTKFWATDPDGTLWEIYTLEEDIDHSGFEDPSMAPYSETSGDVWEHRLTDALPERIPHDDDSLDKVNLEGTFNALLPRELIALFLKEAKRVLKPGGRISARGLVSDKPMPNPPTLPGPASLVQYVPTDVEVLETLAAAGFGALIYEKLAAAPSLDVKGAELRELRLTGRKQLQSSGLPTTLVMYKGPFAEVIGEDGTVFHRGEAIRLTPSAAENLRNGPARDQFAILCG
jgi:catechol 2,3-dioxygenase-like lactoylglutathione lyase family enzyme